MRLRHSVLSQTDGATPLLTASHAGHVEVVKALLVGGAAVNQAKVRGRVPHAVTSHRVHATQDRVWCACSMTSLDSLFVRCD